MLDQRQRTSLLLVLAYRLNLGLSEVFGFLLMAAGVVVYLVGLLACLGIVALGHVAGAVGIGWMTARAPSVENAVEPAAEQAVDAEAPAAP